MRSYGYIKSDLTGNELKFEAKEVPLYKSFDLRSRLDPIRDQGNIPKCVSVALTDMINFKVNINKYPKVRFKDDIFYKNRFDKNLEGMQPVDAFDQFTRGGVRGLNGSIYAKVTNSLLAKYAIISNGPVMICLPVRSFEDKFWLGNDIYGGHAVLLVGYNNDGFILRNSWGTSYGVNGYTLFPESDFNKIYESWTLVS